MGRQGEYIWPRILILSRKGLIHLPESCRHFTVAVFVVHDGRVLLIYHRRYGRWLPPGGHVEADETPDEAAVREVREETGLTVVLPAASGGIVPGGPRLLARPAGIQLEEIAPNHEPIDLVYFAFPAPGSALLPQAGPEAAAVGWYAPSDWTLLGVDGEIQAWAARAIGEAGVGGTRGGEGVSG